MLLRASSVAAEWGGVWGGGESGYSVWGRWVRMRESQATRTEGIVHGHADLIGEGESSLPAAGLLGVVLLVFPALLESSHDALELLLAGDAVPRDTARLLQARGHLLESLRRRVNDRRDPEGDLGGNEGGGRYEVQGRGGPPPSLPPVLHNSRRR